MSADFKFNLSKPIVPVKSNPTLRHPTTVEIGPSVDVAELRRQWTEGVLGDSFRNWADSAPDEVFLKWVDSVRQSQMRQSWETAVKTVLSLRGGTASYQGKIAMDELLACEAYKQLSAIDQKSACWIVENHQRKDYTAKS